MGLDLSRKQALEAYGPAEVYEPKPRSVCGYVQGLTRLSQRTPWPFGEFREGGLDPRPKPEPEGWTTQVRQVVQAGRMDARFTLDQAASRLLATVH